MMEEFEVDTCIEVTVLLPRDVILTFGGEAQCSLTVGGSDIVEICITELTDVIITLLTVAGFEF